MTELFEIPEHKSPRLLWMEEHGVRTLRGKGWCAWLSGDEASGSPVIGHGETETEALLSLAAQRGIRPWNWIEKKKP